MSFINNSSTLYTLPFVVMYVILFCLTIWINKFILSSLSFTYPLVFQGWQTFVGALGFTILNKYNFIDIKFSNLGWSSIKHIGPYMVCFTFGLYTGSKALTGMHIPIFLSLHNILFLFQHVADLWARRLECEKSSNVVIIIIPLTIIALSTTMVLSTSLKEFRGALFWMILHLISSGVLVFLDQLDKSCSEQNALPKLYCCFIFSVIILGSTSFFLGEVFKVYNFPLLKIAKFYISFILSGILACLLGLCFLKLNDHQFHWLNLMGVAKITAASLSLLLFEFEIQNTMCKLWISLSLLTGVFTPLPNKIIAELKNESSEQLNPILQEDDNLTDNEDV